MDNEKFSLFDEEWVDIEKGDFIHMVFGYLPYIVLIRKSEGEEKVFRYDPDTKKLYRIKLKNDVYMKPIEDVDYKFIDEFIENMVSYYYIKIFKDNDINDKILNNMSVNLIKNKKNIMNVINELKKRIN